MIETSARLITKEYSGELGKVVVSETENAILCNLYSIDRREYYAAYNSGFLPDWRVTTNPVNYTGQEVIDLDTEAGTVRCDIYRTYRKSQDEIELWCRRQNPQAVQTFTLWSYGRCVTLFGCYLTGTDGVNRTDTGRVATDTVALILPQTFRAFVGITPAAYCRPKAYALLPDEEKTEHFTIDEHCFFALGRLETIRGLFVPELADSLTTKNDRVLWVHGVDAANAKYQEVNSLYDDVYLVQSVARKNRGKPDTEYLEVTGK